MACLSIMRESVASTWDDPDKYGGIDRGGFPYITLKGDRVLECVEVL